MNYGCNITCTKSDARVCGGKQKGNLIYEKKVIYNHRISAPFSSGEITKFCVKIVKAGLNCADELQQCFEFKASRFFFLPRVELLAISQSPGVVHRQHVSALCFAGTFVRLVYYVNFQVCWCFTINCYDCQKASK